PVVSGTVDEQTVTKTATVQKVDQKTRHVTLRRPDGTKFTIVVGPEVHNLRQVKKGDVVSVTYRESIAYEVKKSDQAHPGVARSTELTRAPLGGKPRGTGNHHGRGKNDDNGNRQANAGGDPPGPERDRHRVKGEGPGQPGP